MTPGIETAPLPLARDKLRKWIKVQEDAIEQARIVASKALDAGDLRAALDTMREHLSELEERVVEQVRKSAAGEDLGAVFGV